MVRRGLPPSRRSPHPHRHRGRARRRRARSRSPEHRPSAEAAPPLVAAPRIARHVREVPGRGAHVGTSPSLRRRARGTRAARGARRVDRVARDTPSAGRVLARRGAARRGGRPRRCERWPGRTGTRTSSSPTASSRAASCSSRSASPRSGSRWSIRASTSASVSGRDCRPTICGRASASKPDRSSSSRSAGSPAGRASTR